VAEKRKSGKAQMAASKRGAAEPQLVKLAQDFSGKNLEKLGAKPPPRPAAEAQSGVAAPIQKPVKK
jgi:hypothetical protein